MSRPFARLLLVLFLSSLLLAQNPETPPPSQPKARTTKGLIKDPSTSDPQFSQRRNSDPPPSESEIKLQKEHEKQMLKERFESLKKDTDKLLALANELKQNVDKSGVNTLSLDVVKKADEIEKLAKHVREKMTAY